MNQFPIFTYKGVLEEDFPFKIKICENEKVNTILHAHEHLQLSYVMLGSCLHYTEGKEFVLTKGDLLSIPPSLEHKLTALDNQPVKLVQIDFMPHCISENLKDLSRMHDFVDFAYIEPFVSEFNVVPKLYFAAQQQLQLEHSIATLLSEWNQRQDNYRLAIKAELLKLLVLISREYLRQQTNTGSRQSVSQHREAFFAALRYLDEHCEEELRLEDLAAMSHMAPSYFSSMMKLMTGQSYIEYLTTRRVEKAAELLRTTNLSITEISLQTGYNHPGHFAKMFKRLMGLTPGEFRRNQPVSESSMSYENHCSPGYQ